MKLLLFIALAAVAHGDSAGLAQKDVANFLFWLPKGQECDSGTKGTIEANARSFFSGYKFDITNGMCTSDKEFFALEAKLGQSNIQKANKEDQILSFTSSACPGEPCREITVDIELFEVPWDTNTTLCHGEPVYVSGAETFDPNGNGAYEEGPAGTTQGNGATLSYQQAGTSNVIFKGGNLHWQIQLGGSLDPLDSGKEQLDIGKFGQTGITLSCVDPNTLSQVKDLEKTIQRLEGEKQALVDDLSKAEGERDNNKTAFDNCKAALPGSCPDPEVCEVCETCELHCFDDLSTQVLVNNDFWWCDELLPSDCLHDVHGDRVSSTCPNLCGKCTEESCQQSYHTKVHVEGVGSIYCDQLYAEDECVFEEIRKTCCNFCSDYFPKNK